MARSRMESFLKRAGVRKNSDLAGEIRKAFGAQEGSEIITEFSRIFEEDEARLLNNERLENIAREDALNTAANRSLKMMKLFAGYYDYDFFMRLEPYLEKTAGCLGLRILDKGCGSGLLSCYVASIKPSAEVIGHDINPACLKNACLIARQLKLKNVRFAADVAEEGTFDTVLSFRTFHENLPVLLVEGNMTHEESIEMQRPYAEELRSYLKEGGYLISAERYENNDHYQAMLQACALEGLRLMTGSRQQIELEQVGQMDIYQCAVFTAE